MQQTAPPAPFALPAISGTVHGGQQPVGYSTLQLYAAGATGYASAATPLIPAGSYYLGGASGCVASSTQTCYPGVVSDANGNFTITSDYTCPSATAQVYLVATGGNPGLTAGANNPALALMAALGSCGSLTATTPVTVNEATTVAAVWALAPFMTGYTHVGASSTNASGLARAMVNARALVDVPTGITIPEGNETSALNLFPEDAIDSLADILASCVNSTGSTATGSTCAQLIAAASPSGAPAPSDTVGMAVNIAQNPGKNVSTLFSLIGSSPPFQKTLPAAPNDWTLSIRYQFYLKFYSASAIDPSGNLWWTTYYDYICSDGAITPSGAIDIPIGCSTTGLSGFTFDPSGNLWAGYGTSLAVIQPNGTQIATYPGEKSAAFDIAGNAWLTGSEGLSIYSSTGTSLATDLSGAYGAVADPTGGMWGYGSSGTLIRSVFAAGAVTTTTYTGATNASSSLSALATDHAGNVWVNGASGLSKYTISGSTVTSPTPFTGGGLTSGPIAVDGNGNVWVASKNSISEFSNSGVAISPSGGYGATVSNDLIATGSVPLAYNPFALAIDLSGSISVLSPETYGEVGFGDYGPYGYALTYTIGVAAPVSTVVSPGSLP